MSLFSFVTQEIDVFFSFSWRDWSTTLIPGSIFAVGAMRGLPIQTAIANYLFLISWIFHFVYFFTLSNQITGAVEDCIDKKDRPIPSGKVTLRGAKIRWMIITLNFIAISIYEPTIFAETFTWIFTTAFLCLTRGGNHWFGKNNISMTTGTWALLSSTWKLIAPLNPTAQTWIYAVALWLGIIMHVQDLRDIEGDIASGRKTLCIQFGNWRSRLIISFFIIPISMFILHLGHILKIAPRDLIVLHAILGYRVLQMKGSSYDHKTYMLLTYIFCYILALLSAEGVDFQTYLNNISNSYDFIRFGSTFI